MHPVQNRIRPGTQVRRTLRDKREDMEKLSPEIIEHNLPMRSVTMMKK